MKQNSFSLAQIRKFTSVLKTAWKITCLWWWIFIIFISWNSWLLWYCTTLFSFDIFSCVDCLLSKFSVLTCDYKLLCSCSMLPISLISLWTRDLSLSSATTLVMTLFPVSHLQHNSIFISKSLVVISQITLNSEYIKPHSLSFHQYFLGVWVDCKGRVFSSLSCIKVCPEKSSLIFYLYSKE